MTKLSIKKVIEYAAGQRVRICKDAMAWYSIQPDELIIWMWERDIQGDIQLEELEHLYLLDRIAGWAPKYYFPTLPIPQPKSIVIKKLGNLYWVPSGYLRVFPFHGYVLDREGTIWSKRQHATLHIPRADSHRLDWRSYLSLRDIENMDVSLRTKVRMRQFFEQSKCDRIACPFFYLSLKEMPETICYRHPIAYIENFDIRRTPKDKVFACLIDGSLEAIVNYISS